MVVVTELQRANSEWFCRDQRKRFRLSAKSSFWAGIVRLFNLSALSQDFCDLRLLSC